MKKLILFALLLMIITGYSYSQSGWFWQNPYPTGNDYLDVDFYNEIIGYAVGWNATVVKTTNAGNNWFLVNRPAGILDCVEVLDSNILVVSGGNGVFKSVNSGLNWQLVSTLTNVKDIYFINQNTGYLTSPARIYKTTDGTATWNTSYNNPGSYQNINFINGTTGFVSTDNSYILKTTNEGVNWSSLSLPFNVPEVFFINENTGYGAGDRKLLKSTNGGINWTVLLNTSSMSSPSISFKSLDTGYISHTHKIYKTLNGGISWDSVDVNGLTVSIASLNPKTCIAVGSGGQIVKTSNTGTNWNCISSPLGNIGPLNSIQFSSFNTGYICGAGGVILKTTNSGNNWQKLFSGTGENLNKVHLINDLTGFACGNNRKLIYTSNGGNIWDSLISPNINSPIWDVHFLDFNTGFITFYGSTFRTSNRGQTWQQISIEYPGTNSRTFIQFVNQQTGYCLSVYNQIPGPRSSFYTTTNYGINWVRIFSFGTIEIKDFQMLDENTGYAVSNNNVRMTTNGGINWQLILNGNGDTRALYFIDENTGYLPGFKTTNTGVTWYRQYVDIQDWLLNDITFINPTTGFMVGGYGGTIFKTTDGGGTLIPIGISISNSEIPDVFNLNQNYPNPFNPVTKIRFDIPVGNGRDRSVKLIVYDILGREVATLVNEELKPGTYEADWDAADFSSGVYFYKIIASDYTETKKMVLMK